MTQDAKLQVFVVDDDAFVSDAASQALCRAGFEVSTFDNALDAALDARRSAPDVVITDYEMPDVNGLMLAAWLQENCPDCKTVILTGQATAVEEQAVAGLKFTLLEKPVNPRVLIETVQEAGSVVAGVLINRKC